ncbi:MAG: glycosyltransferase family 39 protein [Gemmataceae bacterium]|nr:glycosyltransferase family 39 protein [Gemmataceae bacterium]
MASVLFFTRLTCPLLEPEETRYAEIPRQMLAQGRLLEPVWHGQPYYHKPPLLYWLVMAVYAVCGVYDWSARLVPALAGVATVLVAYLWGRHAAGRWAGFLGALVLCLSARFVYLGRMLGCDGLLCLWVVVALAAAHAAVSTGRLRWLWWLLSALASGLGLLTKGPVALVLVLPPLMLFQILDRRAARPRLVPLLAYLAVALGVAAPWYVAVAVQAPEAASAFVWQHNLLRYVAPLDHGKPLWFYLPPLLLGTLPWSLLLVPLTRLLVRREPDTADRRPPALGLFLLASGWCVLFFSLSGCKRPGYVLPALPPLALALGCYLAGSVEWGMTGAVERGTTMARLALGVALWLGIVGSVIAVIVGVWPAVAGGVAAGLLAVGWGVWAWYRLRLSAALTWGLCAAVVFAVFLTAICEVLPGYHRRFGLRGQVRCHRALAAEPGVAVVCYPRRWDSVSFYLGRDDVRVYGTAERAELFADLSERPTTLVFVSCRHLEEFRAALPAGLEFAAHGRAGGFAVAGIVRPKTPASGGVSPLISTRIRGLTPPARRVWGQVEEAGAASLALTFRASCDFLRAARLR